MKVVTRALLGSALCSCMSPVFAQTDLSQPAVQPAVAIQSQPVATLAPAPATGMLRAGTPIALTMSEELTTKGKKLRVGQRFQLAVAEDLVIDGQIVVPAGSPATGEITEVRNKGMWGKSGAINARLLFLRANGRQIRLSGALDDKGVTGTAGVVGAIAFVPVAGFFVTGTSAVIPLGAPVNAFIDEDVAVTYAAAPSPMTVQSAAPVIQAASAPATPATPK